MKRLIVLSLLLLVLAACNTTKEPAANENTADNKVNEIENNENNKENNENEAAEKDEVNTTPPAETPKEEEKPKEEAPKTSVEKKEPSNDASKKEEKPVEKDNPEQMLISMAEKIMQAQFDKDVSYLKSVISKGTKIEGETFSFNNVTYPHKQEFFTKETASDLSFRYPHKNNEESYIIGFAAIDEVNEHSFVIDFEFVLENGEWKMNDMDVNK